MLIPTCNLRSVQRNVRSEIRNVRSKQQNVRSVVRNGHFSYLKLLSMIG